MFDRRGAQLEAAESSKELGSSVVPGEWGEGLVESSLTHARMIAHHQSRFYADIIGLLAVYSGDRDLVDAEIAASHRLTRRTSEAEVDLAMDLACFSEVHAAPNKMRHVCERRRDGEAAVSRENEAGGLFQHPAERVAKEHRAE